MNPLTPIEVVRCVTLYHYNVDPITQYEAASGRRWADTSERYKTEKIADYHGGLVHWFGRFDRHRQERWVAAAVEKYGDDARHESELHAKLAKEKG